MFAVHDLALAAYDVESNRYDTSAIVWDSNQFRVRLQLQLSDDWQSRLPETDDRYDVFNNGLRDGVDITILKVTPSGKRTVNFEVVHSSTYIRGGQPGVRWYILIPTSRRKTRAKLKHLFSHGVEENRRATKGSRLLSKALFHLLLWPVAFFLLQRTVGDIRCNEEGIYEISASYRNKQSNPVMVHIVAKPLETIT